MSPNNGVATIVVSKWEGALDRDDAVFTLRDEMMEVHPAAAETVPANFTRNGFLPFHTGAAEWYYRKAATGVVRGD